jgi:hypothetical protein
MHYKNDVKIAHQLKYTYITFTIGFGQGILHKDTITDLYQCKQLLCIRFGTEQEYNKQLKYQGQEALVEHLAK